MFTTSIRFNDYCNHLQDLTNRLPTFIGTRFYSLTISLTYPLLTAIEIILGLGAFFTTLIPYGNQQARYRFAKRNTLMLDHFLPITYLVKTLNPQASYGPLDTYKYLLMNGSQVSLENKLNNYDWCTDHPYLRTLYSLTFIFLTVVSRTLSGAVGVIGGCISLVTFGCSKSLNTFSRDHIQYFLLIPYQITKFVPRIFYPNL